MDDELVSSSRIFRTKSKRRSLEGFFSRYGKLMDVYFGDRKGKNGKNYGFIRFVDVLDAKDMETKINREKCINNILEVNIVRHGRKAHQIRPMHKWFVPPIQNFTTSDEFVDKRSYAEVTGNKKNQYSNQARQTPTFQQTNKECKILLQPDDHMKRWIQKTTMIGEVFSLQYVGHLSALLSIHSDKVADVKIQEV